MRKREFLSNVFGFRVYGDYRLNFKKVDSETLEINMTCFDEFTKTIYIDDEFIYDLEGNIITNIETLDKFEEWLEFNVCELCQGEGYREIDVSGECTKYIGDCCGGCTKYVVCECKE